MSENQAKPSNLKDRLNQLYFRLGGDQQLEKILTVFYAKMAADVMVGYFFFGKDLSHIVKQQKNFLMRAMGVSQQYEGKTPATAHENLPKIRTGHFDRRMVLLRETLEEFSLSPEDIQTWLSYEESFRSVVTS